MAQCSANIPRIHTQIYTTYLTEKIPHPSDLPELHHDPYHDSPTSATVSTPPGPWQGSCNELQPWTSTQWHDWIADPHQKTDSYAQTYSSGKACECLDCSWHYQNDIFSPINNGVSDRHFPITCDMTHHQLPLSYSSLPPHSYYYSPTHPLPLGLDPSVASGSTYDPSSTLPSPIQTKRLPIKLHQPRPSRRIPIVDLSELASASINSHSPTDNMTIARQSYDTSQSTRINTSYQYATAHPTHDISQLHVGCPPAHTDIPFCSKLAKAPVQKANTILCSCGCMESYTLA